MDPSRGFQLIGVLFGISLGYADVNVAASEALREAAHCSQNRRECGGVIYSTPYGYVISESVVGKKFQVDLGPFWKNSPPKGWRIDATYHVHICVRENKDFANFFSDGDVDSDTGLHTVGYMLSLCDGNVRRFDPRQDDRDDEEVDFHSGRKIYLTCGHISGWVDLRRAR